MSDERDPEGSSSAREQRLERRAQRAREELEARKDDLAHRLAKAARTLARRLEAVRSDLARVSQVPALRRDAALLLSHLHAIRADQRELSAVDYEVDPPATTTIAIDPALGARRQADAWFARARKLERGAKLAAVRESETQRAIEAIAAVRSELAGAADAPALDALTARARALGVAVEASPAKVKAAGSPRPAERLPYREFQGSGERRILVGRSADDNDRLTLDHARPHDLWLHARDSSGSHVVVPLTKGEACPPDLLCDAATLAAHFSQARGQGVVDVIHVARRYVRKRRKAPAGQVSVEREKVLRLQLEPGRLKRLLAAERGRL
jgi:predicted ribosome quality control (RQC) complex YloA/Tae2 family protein